MATAASAAVPPACSVRKPASVASGWEDAHMPRLETRVDRREKYSLSAIVYDNAMLSLFFSAAGPQFRPIFHHCAQFSATIVKCLNPF